MKKQSLITISVLMFGLFAHAEKPQKEKEPFLANKTITVQTPKIKIPKGEFIYLSADGRVKVYPSDELDGYIRSEKINLGAGLTQGLGDVLSVGARAEATGEFIRFFKKRPDALKIGLEFDPDELPHTAERALKLTSGDYYRVQGKGVFSAGAAISDQLLQVVKFSVGVEFFVYSDFQFEVYKKEGSKVFVRASSLSEDGVRVFAKIKSGASSELIDIGLLDKLLPTLVNFNILTKSKGKFFSVEYSYNLEKDSARGAYDSLLNYEDWDLKDLKKVLSPVSKGGLEAVQIMIDKSAPSEKLSMEDAELTDYAVRRGVRSKMSFGKSSTGLAINVLLAKMNSDLSHTDQKFSVMKDHRSEDFEHFRISTTELKDDWSVFFKRYFEDITQRASIIFGADDKGEIVDFKQLNFSYERVESNTDKREIVSIQKRLRKLFPEEIYNEVTATILGSGESPASFIDKGTTRVEYAASVNGKIFESIAQLEEPVLRGVVEDFFTDLSVNPKRYGISSKDFIQEERGEDAQGQVSLYQALKPKIKNLIAELANSFLKSADVKTNEERWESLTKLQHDRFFQTFGSGVLMRLAHKAVSVNGESLKDYLYFSLNAKTREATMTPINYGDYSDQNRFLELLELKDSVLNREYSTKYSGND